MPTSAERGRHVRARLLQAAAELVAEQGWNAVSTRMVAERAGVAPGLVHYHFASLPALLTEAAVQVMEGVVDGAAHGLSQARTAAQALELMLADLDRYPGDDPASRLVSEAMLASGRDEGLRTAMAGLLERFRARLGDRLAAQGVPDPRGTAAVLAAALDGMMLHRSLDPELTSTAVAPVLGRLLQDGTPGTAQEGHP
ncbi:TetR/AcrR family transcriptional regulator [Nocardiopsis suaedae]|uniref:TetR/AcrR family transcriptional regulator n=1 Tax=Nocardiopsis suaedae TaxID=3018444 RepID=A0ABT4TPY0_9ACTN|nr:TetR/AcrR family transcriptional regulator [Nocardiopsis suaedae]MDA2806739.1 TetR/AcrR family transcriptional regulator [Nocardiopsis suaedae]